MVAIEELVNELLGTGGMVDAKLNEQMGVDGQ